MIIIIVSVLILFRFLLLLDIGTIGTLGTIGTILDTLKISITQPSNNHLMMKGQLTQ